MTPFVEIKGQLYNSRALDDGHNGPRNMLNK